MKRFDMDSDILKDNNSSDDDDSIKNIKISKHKLILHSDDSDKEIEPTKSYDVAASGFGFVDISKKDFSESRLKNKDPAESGESDDNASINGNKSNEEMQQDSLQFPEIDTEDFLSQGKGKFMMNEDIYDAEESDEEINSRSRIAEDESDFRKSSDIYNAEESDNENNRSTTLEKSGGKNHKTDNEIYDAEGSSDEASKENYFSNKEDKFTGKSEKHKTKTKKKPEKKVENDIDEIHKESQRMVRQSHISLPYHRPKQRTLSDFLNRRKSAPIVPLRTSNDQLSKVWKHLEEREKTVETFYKSESSSEDENIKPKDNLAENNNSGSQAAESEAAKIEDCTTIIIESEDVKVNDSTKLEFSEDTKVSSDCANSSEPVNEPLCDPAIEQLGNLETDNGSERTDNLKTTVIIEHSESVTNNVNIEDSLVFIDDSVKCDSLTVNSVETSDVPIKGKGKLSETKSILNESLFPLEFTPKLTADEGDIVELDVDKKRKPGPIGLMTRFIKHVKLKHKVSTPPETSKEKSGFESSDGILQKEEKEVMSKAIDMKPGQRFVQLKHSLKLSIEATRTQMFNTKIQQQQLYEEEYCEMLGVDNKETDDEELSDKDTTSAEKDDGQMLDTNKSDDGDGVGSDDDNCEFEEEDEEEQDADDFSLKKQNKSGGRMFIDEEASESDDSGCDNGNDSDSVEEPNKLSTREDLFGKYSDFENESLRREPSEADLLGVCSGQFQTQPIDLLQLEKPTQKYDFFTHDDEEEDNDSDQKQSDVDSENSDDEDTEREGNKSKVIESDDDSKDTSANLKSKKPKQQRKLVFSDDDLESENNEENQLSDSEEKISEGENSEIDEVEGNEEKVLDYNSEEEIIEAKKFLDVEAELSGSEWGSEDENEEGLSDFEADQADLEKIDQSKLRRDLERIHVKELLAEDKREVRLIKELLLEDGELHSDGPKRQRLYRWSNQGGDFPVRNPGDPIEELNQEDEIEDTEWRLQRIEREKFITDNLKMEDNVEFELNVPLGSIDDKKKKKLQPKPNQTSNSDPKSPDPKQPFKTLTKRGSFLGRGEKVLSRLAGLVPTESNNSRVKRNMVFSIVSPPKEEDKTKNEQDLISSEKRKATEAIPKVTKKLKFSSDKKNSSIFEKLKQID